MFQLISRKRLLVAGVAAAITAGGAGGAFLAGHATAAQVTTASSGQGQSQAAGTPSPGPKAKGPHPGRGLGRLAGNLHLVKVVTLDGQQLTVADSAGTQTTYTVAANARVSGPKGATETLADLKPGELVILVGGHARKPAAGASPQPSPSPATTTPTVIAIRDTGFVAA